MAAFVFVGAAVESAGAEGDWGGKRGWEADNEAAERLINRAVLWACLV